MFAALMTGVQRAMSALMRARNCAGVRQLRLDHLALLQIVSGDDKLGGLHGFDPLRFTRSDLCACR